MFSHLNASAGGESTRIPSIRRRIGVWLAPHRIVLPFLLVACAATAFAAPLRFPDHNFSVELPPGWVPINPQPPDTLLAVKSPDGARRILVATAKLPEAERAKGIENVIDRLKASMAKQSWSFEAAQSEKIGDLPFSVVKGHGTADASALLAYVAGAGEDVVILMFLGRNGLSPADPELLATVQSFAWIKPAAALAVSAPAAPVASGFGHQLLTAALIALGVWGAWLIFRSFFKGKRA
jgi:hypothetical protein